MSPWMKVLAAMAIASIGFAAGHHVAALSGEASLSSAKEGWAKEREAIARDRATAIEAQRVAEHKQAEAIRQAAESYERGKSDAETSSAAVVADLRSGALRLRDQWATCRATSEVLASSAGQRADGEDGLRAEGFGRVLRIVGQCQAQRDALQSALIGERQAIDP